MRVLFFALAALCSHGVFAGERCIALDGDTLVCNHRKVRLTNIYAAELNQPGGLAAKRRLHALVSTGEVVLRLLGSDRYGRTLAEVYVSGRRIEQTDIGPRAGRGAAGQVYLHRFIHRQKPRAS
jgi:hypothetical protein